MSNLRKLDQSTDARLARAIEGDHESLSALLIETGAALRAALTAKIPREHQAVLTADDVLQESYSEAFVTIRNFVPRRNTSFQLWLATIAERNLIDALRMLRARKRPQTRDARSSSAAFDSTDRLTDLLLAPSQSAPSRAAARNEFRTTLSRAIQTLPSSAQKLVQLYDLDERPVEDVASLLGCTVGAVYVRRGRVHRRLRELLGPTTGFFTDAV